MDFVRSFVASSAILVAAGAAAQSAREHTIRFGHLVQPGHPISLGVKRFGEILEQKSGARMHLKEFAGGMLGGEQQQLSAVQGGIQEITMPSAATMGGVVKEFTLLDMPFTFSKAEQVDALLNGPFGQKLQERLPEKGLVGLGFWETGFRNFTNSRRPVLNPEDLKGLKVRVIGNPLMLETFAALGANPVPMAFPELYGALETRAIDAQENPSSIILTSKFYEVQKFMSVTNHVYTANPVVISKKFWDKLSPSEQKVIREAATEAGAYQREVSRDAAERARKELENNGMKVNDVPAATLAKMQDLTKPVSDKFAASYDPALVNLFRSEMERIAPPAR